MWVEQSVYWNFLSNVLLVEMSRKYTKNCKDLLLKAVKLTCMRKKVKFIENCQCFVYIDYYISEWVDMQFSLYSQFKTN